MSKPKIKLVLDNFIYIMQDRMFSIVSILKTVLNCDEFGYGFSNGFSIVFGFG